MSDNINYELLKHIFSVKTEELFEILKTFLKSKYGEENVIAAANGGYLLAKGEIPVCLVAHIDTVFPNPPDNIFHDQLKNVMWSPQGLGADDRAGVYSIIHIILDGYLPSIVFTDKEEVGGLGAIELVKDFPVCPFKDLKMILELDRQGEDDCVFYKCWNPDFIDYIESMGFYYNTGSFSDISFFAPNWGIAAANLSIGYIGEHFETEYLKIDDMFLTILKVEAILEDKSLVFYKYIPSAFFKSSTINY